MTLTNAGPSRKSTKVIWILPPSFSPSTESSPTKSAFRKAKPKKAWKCKKFYFCVTLRNGQGNHTTRGESHF